MKSFKIFFVSIFLFHHSFSQKASVVIQPDSICGQDAMVWNAPGFPNGNTNYGSNDALGINAWTNLGIPDTTRSLIQFDLSFIPVGSVVTFAYLSLYNNPNASFAQGQHSTLSGGNDLYIQRITGSWDEQTVTWFSQPPSTTQNQVLVPASTSAHQDYPNINVSALVQDMIDNPQNSFGFLLRLQDETYYRDMVFASSDCSDPAKWPSLYIQYILPANGCYILQPHHGCGRDAIVWNAPGFPNATTNYGLNEAIGAHAWTNNGIPDTARSLLSFDLTSLPANAIINYANLSLYNNPNASYAGGSHSWLSGPNTGRIERITSAWDEKTVTWITKPTSTTQNQTLIPASTNIHQDYLNLDVTQLVIDMYNDPQNSFGFLIRLDDEQFYRALVFASSNCTDQSKNPKLEVCYSIPDGLSKEEYSPIKLFPNPAHDRIFLEFDAKEYPTGVSIDFFNSIGKLVNQTNWDPGQGLKEITIVDSAPGLYFIKVNDGTSVFFKKLIIE